MVDLKDLSQEKVYQKLKKEYETKNKGNAVSGGRSKCYKSCKPPIPEYYP